MARLGTPTSRAIALYWEEHESEFPENMRLAYGSDAYACMSCGYEAETPGGIERAHLQCFAYKQNQAVENFVLLCHECHRSMPAFDDAALALAWVRVLARARQTPTMIVHESCKYGQSVIGPVGRLEAERYLRVMPGDDPCCDDPQHRPRLLPVRDHLFTPRQMAAFSKVLGVYEEHGPDVCSHCMRPGHECAFYRVVSSQVARDLRDLEDSRPGL